MQNAEPPAAKLVLCRRKLNMNENAILSKIPLRDRKTFPVPIKKIAESYGFKIYCQKYERPDICGIIGTGKVSKKYTGYERFIGVDSTEDVKQQRFIIAQELVYFLLEGENEDSFCHVNYITKTSNAEESAKNVTLALLMPENEFKKQYFHIAKKEPSLSDLIFLSDHFGAPLSAVKKRIKQIV